MFEFCTVSQQGSVTIITINRPAVMNSLHPPANFELESAVQAFEADPNARVAIFTGAGEKAFSAGNDLKYTAAGNKLEVPKTGFGGLTKNFARKKPVIAAVNGVALGGGFEIALACDLIIASENAIFGLPEPKVGLAALAGGLNRLPRQIGLKNALGMILTGRHVSAAEGKTLGFVNEVVAVGGALNTAIEWANTIAANSPQSIRTSLDVVKRSLNFASLEESIDAHYDSVAELRNGADAVEGPLAFAEKRKPKWSA
ncbi:MAG: enoyl-CoA hydratase-related protein [Proteobacteria bacterium]|nr:enoyl-CoA hydratase-related protein [Pseudomonadota bacterium]